jgi:hypothetical protein
MIGMAGYYSSEPDTLKMQITVNNTSIPCLIKYKLHHYTIQIVPVRQHNRILIWILHPELRE